VIFSEILVKPVLLYTKMLSVPGSAVMLKSQRLAGPKVIGRIVAVICVDAAIKAPINAMTKGPQKMLSYHGVGFFLEAAMVVQIRISLS